MIREDGRGLSVHTFKALSLEYNGKPLNLHRCGTKVIMLLLQLLLGGGDGVPKYALVSAIYGHEDEAGADYNQYVNNLIYRLKKLLNTKKLQQTYLVWTKITPLKAGMIMLRWKEIRMISERCLRTIWLCMQSFPLRRLR